MSLPNKPMISSIKRSSSLRYSASSSVLDEEAELLESAQLITPFLLERGNASVIDATSNASVRQSHSISIPKLISISSSLESILDPLLGLLPFILPPLA